MHCFIHVVFFNEISRIMVQKSWYRRIRHMAFFSNLPIQEPEQNEYNITVHDTVQKLYPFILDTLFIIIQATVVV